MKRLIIPLFLLLTATSAMAEKTVEDLIKDLALPEKKEATLKEIKNMKFDDEDFSTLSAFLENLRKTDETIDPLHPLENKKIKLLDPSKGSPDSSDKGKDDSLKPPDPSVLDDVMKNLKKQDDKGKDDMLSMLQSKIKPDINKDKDSYSRASNIEQPDLEPNVDEVKKSIANKLADIKDNTPTPIKIGKTEWDVIINRNGHSEEDVKKFLNQVTPTIAQASRGNKAVYTYTFMPPPPKKKSKEEEQFDKLKEKIIKDGPMEYEGEKYDLEKLNELINFAETEHSKLTDLERIVERIRKQKILDSLLRDSGIKADQMEAVQEALKKDSAKTVDKDLYKDKSTEELEQILSGKIDTLTKIVDAQKQEQIKNLINEILAERKKNEGDIKKKSIEELKIEEQKIRKAISDESQVAEQKYKKELKKFETDLPRKNKEFEKYKDDLKNYEDEKEKANKEGKPFTKPSLLIVNDPETQHPEKLRKKNPYLYYDDQDFSKTLMYQLKIIQDAIKQKEGNK